MVYYMIKCILGPMLYRIYRNSQTNGRNYTPNTLEYYTNTFIDVFNGFCLVCKWTSPALLAFAYYKGYITYEYLYTACKLFVIFSGFFCVAHILRGIGRHSNPDYYQFIKEYSRLHNAGLDLKSERRQFLYKYDFSMKDWAPDYIASQKHPIFKGENIPASMKTLFMAPLSYLAINTFGLRMMYPGSIIQYLIKAPLIEGRAKIMEIKRATRSMILTNDRQCALDTVFVDHRNTSSKYGKYLIICTDGNASFYEVGIFSLSVDKGYSTLGWNYPGFGESEGAPYPNQITSSIDAIMQYAVSLGFKPEDIILFSWSIGGFPSVWAASHYPDIKAVILDACFDNILHLAVQHMPEFASELVNYAIKTNLNLNILEIIKKYSGPVRLIRRTNDEIVSLIPGKASANRGNDLLIGLIKHRYPYILTDNAVSLIRVWLSAKSEAERVRIYNDNVAHNKDLIEATLISYIEKNTLKYPLDLGKDMTDELHLSFSLYLAVKYLDNFESTHCQPLPLDYIQIPWNELDLLSNVTRENSADYILN